MTSTDQAVREIVRVLRKHRDPARAQQTQHYFKDTVKALGVDTPTLRAVVKEQVKSLKKTWTLTQATKCCAQLLQKQELELRGAGVLILGAFKRDFTVDLVLPAEQWLATRLDNWALVDGFCSAVLSPLLERCPEVEKTLCQWSRAESLWVRRAVLVTFVPFARRGLYLQRSYRLAREHFPDREDLMHKATGWLLREAGKTDMMQLKEFLLQHGPTVPRTAVRYAIERFPASERKQLLEDTH